MDFLDQLPESKVDQSPVSGESERESESDLPSAFLLTPTPTFNQNLENQEIKTQCCDQKDTGWDLCDATNRMMTRLVSDLATFFS